MSTSKPGAKAPGNPVTPPSTPAPNAYARFIPREELGGNVAAWAPQTFERPPAPAADTGVRKPTLAERAAAEMRPGMKSNPAHHAPQATGQAVPPKAAPAGAASPKPAMRRPVVGGMPGQAEAQQREAEAPPPPPAPNVDELVDKARHDGYQDGYRNGLAALESYKQTQAAQMAAQFQRLHRVRPGLEVHLRGDVLPVRPGQEVRLQDDDLRDRLGLEVRLQGEPDLLVDDGSRCLRWHRDLRGDRHRCHHRASFQRRFSIRSHRPLRRCWRRSWRSGPRLPSWRN